VRNILRVNPEGLGRVLGLCEVTQRLEAGQGIGLILKAWNNGL